MALATVYNVVPGTRVVLVNPDPEYDLDERNPHVGGEHECEGTVTDFEDDGFYISVEWDNGCNNIYKDDELLIVKSNKPEGNCKSIW